jgi:hypothetical protein
VHLCIKREREREKVQYNDHIAPPWTRVGTSPIYQWVWKSKCKALEVSCVLLQCGSNGGLVAFLISLQVQQVFCNIQNN